MLAIVPLVSQLRKMGFSMLIAFVPRSYIANMCLVGRIDFDPAHLLLLAFTPMFTAARG